MQIEEASELFEDPHLFVMARCYLEMIKNLTTQIEIMEKEILRVANLKKEFESLFKKPYLFDIDKKTKNAKKMQFICLGVFFFLDIYFNGRPYIGLGHWLDLDIDYYDLTNFGFNNTSKSRRS